MLLLFVWWSTALTDWKRITDKCYHVESYSDAMYWFPSGDDVHFCDCIDTILSLKNLQTKFLEWKELALLIIYSVLEDVCDFMGLLQLQWGKKGQNLKSRVPAPRRLAREINHDRARHTNPEMMGSKTSNIWKVWHVDKSLLPMHHVGEQCKLSYEVFHCQPILYWTSGSK